MSSYITGVILGYGNNKRRLVLFDGNVNGNVWLDDVKLEEHVEKRSMVNILYTII